MARAAQDIFLDKIKERRSIDEQMDQARREWEEWWEAALRCIENRDHIQAG